jgi:hypothetical protein
MSNSVHLAHIAHKAAEGVRKTENPIAGAGYGAAATGGGAAAGLAMAGLALTPVGWAVALGAGAIAGASYVMGKKKR